MKSLDPRTYARALDCIHCGLCLPACPTYVQTGNEADGPRGRIQLMRGLSDGIIEPTPAVRYHLDLCLDCRACETACPSGVVYHELIEETKTHLPPGKPSTSDRMLGWLCFNVLVHPFRLKLAILPVRILQKLKLDGLLRHAMKLLPKRFQKLDQMIPAKGPLWPRSLPEVVASRIPGQNIRVGFFAGCVGSAMFSEVNRKAVDLLSAAGARVQTPAMQQCCGAIHHHNGAVEMARTFARRNIDTFLPALGGASVDFIATTTAGCGAMLLDYPHLLRDDPRYLPRAIALAQRVRDISQLLAEIGMPEMKHPIRQTVVYHDACHLAHAMKVRSEPRKLLSMIPDLHLQSLPESDMCCGAAGTYNLTHPEMAGQLAQRKLVNIAVTGASTCVTGNAGCALHLTAQAANRGLKLTVLHPVELLHAAVFGT